jgi:outer membrane protein TolC
MISRGRHAPEGCMNMAKKIFVVCAAVAILTAGLGFGQATAKNMSLEECLVRAMERNLGLQVQVRNPELADWGVSLAGERFMPVFAFSYGKQSNRSAASSWIDSSDLIENKSNYLTADLTQFLPTGGTLDASVSTGMNETNRRFQTINPYYSGQLSFTFTKPLLRDFGPAISRRQILIARNNRDVAEQNYKRALLDTLYSVEEAYWNLVYSIENLKVMKTSLRLAEDLLTRNSAQLKIGMIAPIEVLTAESEVASRKADILQAEVLVKNREDTLRTLLNFSAEEREKISLIPSDAPTVEKRDLSVETALALAMASRPELMSARVDLSSRDLDLTFARNQLLPRLNLVANYWSPSVSGTQILYQDDNPLSGIVIGTIPGGSDQAIKDALQFKYKNWSVALSLSIPMNALLSRAQAQQAKISLDQSRLAMQNTEQRIFLEVRNAIRDVENNAQRVEAYEIARQLAEKTLDAEERKAAAGLSISYTVLQRQRDLVLAQSRELQARIDYVLSQARLDLATGLTPDHKNISWTDPSKKKS